MEPARDHRIIAPKPHGKIKMQCFVLIVLQAVDSFRCETTGASHRKLAQARIPLLLAAALSLLVIRQPAIVLSDPWLLFIWHLKIDQ